jgi:hypothetical protein
MRQRACVFNLALDQISLAPISCGGTLDAPSLAAWVHCRRFTGSAVKSPFLAEEKECSRTPFLSIALMGVFADSFLTALFK